MKKCQLCHEYEGTVKGLCSHVTQAHEWNWHDYVDWYQIDTKQLSRRNAQLARKGMRHK
jgi:hypothetical protein